MLKKKLVTTTECLPLIICDYINMTSILVYLAEKIINCFSYNSGLMSHLFRNNNINDYIGHIYKLYMLFLFLKLDLKNQVLDYNCMQI